MQSKAQAVLFLGDLSYADRYQYNDVGIRWDTWGRFVEKVTAYQPWIWTAGNHEIEYMPYMVKVYFELLKFANLHKGRCHNMLVGFVIHWKKTKL